MTVSIPRGPLGFSRQSLSIDPGTLARTLSPLPDPVGLYIGSGIPMQIKAKARLRARGITVHAQSQITAQEWVKKIKANEHIPRHFQDPLRAKGNKILLKNPLRFRIPKDVLDRDWTSDWLSVFISGGRKDNREWELTTGCLDIMVKKKDKSDKRISFVHNPDLSKGESVGGFTKYTMSAHAKSVDQLRFEKGNTLPTGVKLKSKRKLIVIANRVALRLDGKVKMFKFTDDELVGTFFHETAAHAGRNALGLPDTHDDDDKTVNKHADEIDDMFSKTTMKRVGNAIEQYLADKGDDK